MATRRAPVCKVCTKAGKSNEPYVVFMELNRNIFEPPVTKSKRKQKREKVEEFLKAATALMNNGRGLVCIHTQIGHFLGLFDEQIDGKLNAMISDGSLFDENFERYFEDDNHVFFRVQPRERDMVTFSSNTKISLNVGLVDPTFYQLKKLLEKVSREEANQNQRSSPPRQTTMTFTSGAEIRSSPGVFQENCRIQAKSIRSELRLCDPANPDRLQQLVDYIWDEVSLPFYISAFSKVVGGGKVLYGVNEEKDQPEYKWKKVTAVGANVPFTLSDPSNWSAWEDANTSQEAGPSYLVLRTNTTPVNTARYDRQASEPKGKTWQRVEQSQVNNIVRVTDDDWQIWEDASDHQVYHVAKECDVPVLQRNTGRFLSDGFELEDDECITLGEQLVQKVKNEMTWLGRNPPRDPVRFTFHRLEPGRTTRVLEVTVPKYHGLAFYNEAGPQAFTVKQGHKPDLITPIGRWVSGFFKQLSLSSAAPRSVSPADCDHEQLRKQIPVFQDTDKLIQIR